MLQSLMGGGEWGGLDSGVWNEWGSHSDSAPQTMDTQSPQSSVASSEEREHFVDGAHTRGLLGKQNTERCEHRAGLRAMSGTHRVNNQSTRGTLTWEASGRLLCLSYPFPCQNCTLPEWEIPPRARVFEHFLPRWWRCLRDAGAEWPGWRGVSLGVGVRRLKNLWHFQFSLNVVGETVSSQLPVPVAMFANALTAELKGPWRWGLGRWLSAKSTCTGPGFSSQNIHGGAQPLVTPVPGDVTPSLDLWGHQSWYTYIHEAKH